MFEMFAGLGSKASTSSIDFHVARVHENHVLLHVGFGFERVLCSAELQSVILSVVWVVADKHHCG